MELFNAYVTIVVYTVKGLRPIVWPLQLSLLLCSKLSV